MTVQHGDSVQYLQNIQNGDWWFVITRGVLKIDHGPFESKQKAHNVMLHLNTKRCTCQACIKREQLS
jgi:hypothetical protein